MCKIIIFLFRSAQLGHHVPTLHFPSACSVKLHSEVIFMRPTVRLDSCKEGIAPAIYEIFTKMLSTVDTNCMLHLNLPKTLLQPLKMAN
jgi:hypothetical protein